MAQMDEKQYSRYYAPDSAARELERQPKKRSAVAVPIPRKRIPIPFDPVAVLGTAVALVMLVCMFIGVAQLNRVNAQVRAMEQQVLSLQAEQKRLEQEYASGYDLEQIRMEAHALGMVDSSQVEHITISLTRPEGEESLSWWHQVWQEIQEFFA